MSGGRSQTGTADGDPLRSALQSIVTTLGLRLLDFVRGVIIARLLVPDEFGRFVLVAAALGALELTTSPGIRDALISVPDEDERTVRTAWTLLVLRGLAVSAFFMALAPVIAVLLGTPDLTPLLRAMGLVPLLRGAASLSVVRQQRRLNVAPLMVLTAAGQLVDTGLAVVLAWRNGEAWSLVAGAIAGATTQLLGSYAVPGFKPGIRLDPRALRELVRFGRWRLVATFVWYLATQGDDLVVGRLLGTGPVGVYRIAYRLANLPTTELSNALAHVAFPAFARSYRDTPGRAQAAYLRYLLLTSGLAAPIAVVLAVGAEPLVVGLLGVAWRPAAAPLQIMCVAGFVRAVLATGGSLFLGAGRPALDTAMQAVRAATLMAFLFLFMLIVPLGVVGAATASALSVLATVPVWIYGIRALGIDPAKALRIVSARLPAAIACALLAWLGALGDVPTLVRLFLISAGGLIGWLGVVLLWDRPLRQELARIVSRLRRIRAQQDS